MMRWEWVKYFADKHKVQVHALAEIGVFAGVGSRGFRAVFPLAHLYLIDPWRDYEGYKEHSGAVNLGMWGSLSNEQLVRVSFADDKNVTIIKDFSVSAAGHVGLVDAVFIDGNHSYDFVKADILTWKYKLGARGILCGHDYQRYGDYYGVKQAVDELLPGREIGGLEDDDCWGWFNG